MAAAAAKAAIVWRLLLLALHEVDEDEEEDEMGPVLPPTPLDDEVDVVDDDGDIRFCFVCFGFFCLPSKPPLLSN